MMCEGSHIAAQPNADWHELVSQSLPAVIWSTDTALRIVTCQGMDALAISPNGPDLCGLSLFELFATEDIQYPPIEAHRRALAGERRPISLDLPDISMRGTVSPVRAGDRVIGSVCVAFALPAVEMRCHAISQTTDDLILFLSTTGMIEDVNRTATGCPREGVVGKTIFEFTPLSEHQRLREAIDFVLQTGKVATMAMMFPRRFDGPAWQTMRIGPMFDRDKVIGMVLLATDITKYRQAVEKLEAKESLLRDLLVLQDRERRLIAYEIHDGFIQDVVGARMVLQGIREPLAKLSADLDQKFDAAVTLMARAINEGRRLISELRPMIIDEMGVVDAVEYLISEEESNGDLAIDFTHRIEKSKLAPLLQATVFRIIREAVTNSRRHGQATHVDIRLTQIADQFLVIEIQDNGSGFDPDAVPKDRFGLTGICERARLFGGGASIESAPDRGTRITVKVALDPPGPIAVGDSRWTWTI